MGDAFHHNFKPHSFEDLLVQRVIPCIYPKSCSRDHSLFVHLSRAPPKLRLCLTKCLHSMRQGLERGHSITVNLKPPSKNMTAFETLPDEKHRSVQIALRNRSKHTAMVTELQPMRYRRKEKTTVLKWNNITSKLRSSSFAKTMPTEEFLEIPLTCMVSSSKKQKIY